MYHEWAALHGHMSASKAVKKLFPRCEAGRWNSTDVAEKRILQCGQHLFLPVLAQVLGAAIERDKCGSLEFNVWSQDKSVLEQTEKNKPSKSSSKAEAPKKRQKLPADVASDLTMEETLAYTRKIGKYRRSTLLCARDALWWALVEIMNLTKQPTVHLSSFLKQKIDKATLAKRGNALCQLVHFKASSLMTEYESVLDCAALRACLDQSLPAKDKSLRLFSKSLIRVCLV